jgi:NADH dehydrogenase (ubiquinone) flavoprotein 2
MGNSSAKTQQPVRFAFTAANLKEAEKIIARYPKGKQASAVIPLLALAQRQHDSWLPRVAMDAVADLLEMPPIRVYEVATFYTMFNLTPVGEHVVQICTTTPCWLRGCNDIVEACEKHLGIGLNETTHDGMFTLRETECLGACVNAPMAMIGDQFYEDLTPDNAVKLLIALKRGEAIKPGPQRLGRQASEPQGGLTTLKNRKSA